MPLFRGLYSTILLCHLTLTAAPVMAVLSQADANSAAIVDFYTISKGDRINVIVANVPEYSGTYQVLVDGTITLPVIGNIDINKMTLSEAAATIAQQYADAQILVQPIVNVALAEVNLVNVTITGEVNRPGAYTMAPVNGELPTLAEAIEKAGGITQLANLQQIQIQRVQRTGDLQTLQVSLWKLLIEGDMSQNLRLRDEDRIALPTAEIIDPATAAATGRSSFAAKTVQINLVGEVRQPGVLQVAPNTTLNQAVLMSGSFTQQARRSSVELLRMNPNGTVSRQRIDIDFSAPVNDNTNPILRDRDVVVVGRSTLARISDTLGTILTPLRGAFSLFDLFSPFFTPSNP